MKTIDNHVGQVYGNYLHADLAKPFFANDTFEEGVGGFDDQ